VRLVIRVEKDFQGRIDKRWLRRLVKEVIAAHGVDTEVELSLLITDDATVLELNRKYRGKDKTTDVLSFALEADKRSNASAGFVMPPGETVHLGEVIVSYPKAVEQAAERNRAVEDELALLVVHGVLHLLGHDHDKPAREREMRSLEQRVLSAVRGRSG
jgi:probable rRNA maturation factor